MNISYLREFEILAETGNFLEAADRLFISQSSLSKHIKHMETELGVPLFIRNTRSISLTPYGSILLENSKKITRLYVDALEKIAEAQDSCTGVVSIGAFSMLDSYGIPELMISFASDYPTIKTKLTKYDESLMLHKLEEGKLDAAFIHAKADIDNNLKQILIARDHLCLAVPTSHPLANRECVNPCELKDEVFIIPPTKTLLNIYFQQLCEENSFNLDNAIMIDTIYNIIHMVSNGMGISLLSYRSFATLAPHNVVAVKLEPEYPTNVYLVYSPKSTSQGLYHFINHVKKKLSQDY